MEVIISIISLIAAVLQIILFFKIWKMTNDVANIKDQTDIKERAHTELLSEDTAGIRKTLEEMFMTEVQGIVRGPGIPDYKKRQIEVAAQKFSQAANKLNVDVAFTSLSKDLYEKVEALQQLS